MSNTRVNATGQRAREAALDTLNDYWADEAGLVSFPVDPAKIAERLGARVSLAKLDANVAGVLVRQEEAGGLQILLNRSDGINRQRFTCAHEVGHIVKRQDSSAPMGFVEYRNEVSGRGTDPEEIFANQFAAELLMPASAVRKWWTDGFSVTKMSKIFNVSEEALEVRLSSLGLSDS